jgi:hypothetical protein
MVRDTLEYAIRKDSYDLKIFDEKKRVIKAELDQPTPLRSIIDHSGENGQKLEKLIRDFYDEVYGDDSTILKRAEDGLRVDHAQHLAIFKGVIPIHENIEAMILGISRDAKNKNIDVNEAVRADVAEERLYRAVAYMTMTADLVKLFGDYNQARREANGAESASSRFIGQDIGTIIGIMNQVRLNSHITDTAYMGMQDKVFDFVENITGRRDLPAGKNFGDVIKDVQASINHYVAQVEPPFKDSYQKLMRELVAQAKADMERAKEAPAPKEEPKPEEPQQTDGEPIELDPRTGMPKA